MKPLRKLQILVVDDSEVIRSIVSQMLKGHFITFAATAEKAFKDFDLLQPDIVLLDINLPDKRGHEVLREMKQKNDKSHIIMLTGSSALKDVVEAMNIGAKGYVVKPFSKQKIQWIIDKYIVSQSEEVE